MAFVICGGFSSPIIGQVIDKWRILAIRVSFPLEIPDDETTSGRGNFDLRPFSEAKKHLRFPFDAPPHDKTYFEAHLQALRNYYHEISRGKVEIEFEVYPKGAIDSYHLDMPLKDYGNGRTRQEISERITQLFCDGITLADSIEGENLDFSKFRAFTVFHAGLGGESSSALNDVPSAFVGKHDLNTFANGPIPVDNGYFRILNGMLLPEAISTDGRGGLNGTLARFFANQLGLPGLSDFENDLPAVGDWSLMDTGANNFTSALRLKLKSLPGDSVDSTLVGFIPGRMTAWSRMKLGWLIPKIITHDDTLRVVAPHVLSDLPEAVQIPINADEYFLVENRISRLTMQNRIPTIEFSRGIEGGVWLSVDDYDAFIPGSGILIWHIDNAVIRRSDDKKSINSNPNYQIAPFQYRRGISLEEADGLGEIGNVSANRVIQNGIISLNKIEGGPEDPFYIGNKTIFGPNTTPNTNSNLNYPTGISIEILSPPGDTMAIAIKFTQNQDGWPITGLDLLGLQVPRVIDLNGDGKKEILRGQKPGLSASTSAWTLDGTLLNGFQFSSSFPPSIGDLVSDEGAIGQLEFIFANKGIPFIWSNGKAIPSKIDKIPTHVATISAPPLIGQFPGKELTDIWGWSDGTVEWGVHSGQHGSINLGADPIAEIAVGNIDTIPGNELVILTKSGKLSFIDSQEFSRKIVAFINHPIGAPAIGDLDRDGNDEIVVVTPNGILSILDQNGIAAQSYPVPGGATSPPVLGDLDGDGFVEAIFGGKNKIWSVRFNGILQTGTPLALPLKDETGPIESPPLLVDLNGNGKTEIIAGSLNGLLYGLTADGRSLPGFPLSAHGPILSSPLIDDLDEDQTLELVLFTANGAIHLWHLEHIDPTFTSNLIFWGQLGGNPGNTGHLLQPPQLLPEKLSTELLPTNRLFCYPNPIKGKSAYLRFFLGNQARVKVIILNAFGEIVDRLSHNNLIPHTENEIFWDTAGYSSGLYICRVEAIANGQSTVKFVKAAIIK